jgi:hypothetical protein
MTDSITTTVDGIILAAKAYGWNYCFGRMKLSVVVVRVLTACPSTM